MNGSMINIFGPDVLQPLLNNSYHFEISKSILCLEFTDLLLYIYAYA